MKTIHLLAVATLALSTLGATAQSAAAPAAKPSPYEGTAQPPVTDVITSSEEAPPTAASPKQPAVTTTPANPAHQAATPPAATINPDGIVEVAVPDEPSSDTSHAPKPVTLQTRPVFNPDDSIVTRVDTPSNQLAEGTPIHARLDQEISSRESGVGTPFTAQITQDVVQNGHVVIPVGSVLHGRVTHADYGRRISGAANLRLSPEEVVLPDGTHYTLHAMVSQTSRGSNTKVNGEGTVQSKDHAKRIAAEYAIGSGGGAIAGAAAAGPVGAIVGSAIGFGVITAHVLLENHAAVLPAESAITFGLTQPMMLTPITNSARN
jgi:hypothetical protein